MLNLYVLQTSKTFHIVSFCRPSIDDVLGMVGPVAPDPHERHLWQQ